jgi:hypothetical protein
MLRTTWTYSSHIGQNKPKLTSVKTMAAITRDRRLTPASMNGRTLGLIAIRAAGQPHRRPPATAAAIHISVLPQRNAPNARTHMSKTSTIGRDHRAGRQDPMV